MFPSLLENDMFSAKSLRTTLVLVLCLEVAWLPLSAASRMPTDSRPSSSKAKQDPQELTDILNYISHGWDSLTRSLTSCDMFKDIKSSEPWQSGNLLLVDNIRTAHTRESFEGPREVLVAMADAMNLAGSSPAIEAAAN